MYTKICQFLSFSYLFILPHKKVVSLLYGQCSGLASSYSILFDNEKKTFDTFYDGIYIETHSTSTVYKCSMHDHALFK